MDDYTRERVTENLDAGVMGRYLHWYATLPSTNGLAMHLAELGAPEGTVVIAEEQSRGRGRRGRGWVSPRGGVWLSVVLRPIVARPLDLPAGSPGAIASAGPMRPDSTEPQDPPPGPGLRREPVRARGPELRRPGATPPGVTTRPGFETVHVPLVALAASVATARAIRDGTGLEARVKWPNDVMVDGAKVVGILAEAGPGVAWVVVGIGINANVPRALLPGDAPYPVTSLAERSGGPIDRARLTGMLLREFGKAYGMLGTEDGPAAVLQNWRELSDTLGRMVRVEGTVREFEGLAADVAADGALLVRLPGGRTERVLAGDVTVREGECG